MPFTAEVLSKTFQDGVVRVTINYTNGSDNVTETYQAANPTAEWIPDTVRDKIALLDAAEAYDITIGPITPSDPVDPTDPNIAVFRSRCRVLEIVKVMIDLGVVASDNAKVVALENWIVANYDAYFDTLA